MTHFQNKLYIYGEQNIILEKGSECIMLEIFSQNHFP